MNDRDEDRDPTGADGTDRVDTDPDGASPDAPAADGAPTGGDTTGGDPAGAPTADDDVDDASDAGSPDTGDDPTPGPDNHDPDTDTDTHDTDKQDTDNWVDADDETMVIPAVDDESHRLAYARVLGDDEPGSGARQDDARQDDGRPEHEPRRGTSANPLRVVLAAAVIGALIAGAIAIAVGVGDSGDVGNTGIGSTEKLAKNAFTESVSGDCLDWAAGDPGNPTKVDCDLRHRFEVADRLDTAPLPGSEFGETATWPGPQRFAQIRDEQCAVIVDRYLSGKRDPYGRFSVSMMFPSQVQWDKGARELRCGLQQTGPDGQPAQFAGRVDAQDQSFKWAPGTCIGIDAARKPTVEVDCTEKHAFQTTGTVDMAVKFGDRLSRRPWPSKEEQNAFLASVCPGQAQRFMGGKEKLEATTLNTQWSVILEPSWLAGSRTAICYIGLPDRGGFATLVGDARETLLINGKLPVPPPQAPPGRALPTPVPLPGGYDANDVEVPAPGG